MHTQESHAPKPISPPILLARVNTHLALKATADFLRSKSDYLQQEVALRTLEVQAIQDVTIMVMAALAETRDSETGNHIRRTQLYVKALAERLREHPRFEAALSERNIELLYKSAPLHDIGKVGIPDSILLKPGKLTVEEFEVMKRHRRTINNIEHAADSFDKRALPALRFPYQNGNRKVVERNSIGFAIFCAFAR